MELEDPSEVVRVGHFQLRILSKEILLADRIVGFKHWRHTSYGEQAIAMIAAFGDALNESALWRRLAQESAVDAFEQLRAMSESRESVTEASLQALLERLHGPDRI